MAMAKNGLDVNGSLKENWVDIANKRNQMVLIPKCGRSKWWRKKEKIIQNACPLQKQER